MKGKKRSILLLILILVSSLTLTACGSRDKVKNPYKNIEKAEEGGFNDSGYDSESIDDKDISDINDPFVRKFVSRLIKEGYDVSNVDERDSRKSLPKYEEDYEYFITVKDKPMVYMYKFNPENKDLLMRIESTNRLESGTNLGSSKDCVVYKNYALVVEGIDKEIVDLFFKLSKGK